MAEPTARATATADLVPVLAALPEQQRAAVVLYYLLDQPTSAVAETLGVTESTVRSHLRNARSRLVGSLGDAAPGTGCREVTP